MASIMRDSSSLSSRFFRALMWRLFGFIWAFLTLGGILEGWEALVSWASDEADDLGFGLAFFGGGLMMIPLMAISWIVMEACWMLAREAWRGQRTISSSGNPPVRKPPWFRRFIDRNLSLAELLKLKKFARWCGAQAAWEIGKWWLGLTRGPPLILSQA